MYRMIENEIAMVWRAGNRLHEEGLFSGREAFRKWYTGPERSCLRTDSPSRADFQASGALPKGFIPESSSGKILFVLLCRALCLPRASASDTICFLDGADSEVGLFLVHGDGNTHVRQVRG